MPKIVKLSANETQRLIQLVEQTKFNYKLDKFSDAASKEILKSTNRARAEITRQLNYYEPTLLKWEKERLKTLGEELQHLTVATQSQIEGNIIQATELAGKASYTAQNSILSFDGRVPNFHPVALSATQLHSMVVTTPVGGRLLNDWVGRTFDSNIQDSIKSELLTGMLKGESYKDMVKRFGDKAFDGINTDMEALTKTYVQSANVNAMDDVMKANSDIVKGWKWNSVCENRTCMECISLDARDEVYPIGQGPEMPAHVRCRCFKEIETLSFREMGVDVDEIEKAYRPYTVRGTVDPITGKITPGKIGVGGGKVIDTGRFLGTYEDFLKLQPEAVQRQILGPSRLELWKSGKVALKDFADKNGNVYLLKELRGVSIGKDFRTSIGKFTQEERGAALEAYQDGGYQTVNAVLRGEGEAFPKDRIAWAEDTTKKMNGLVTETKTDTLVYRGDGSAISSDIWEKTGLTKELPSSIGKDPYDFLYSKCPNGVDTWEKYIQDKMKHQIWTDKGFLSTSQNEQVILDKFVAESGYSKYGQSGMVEIYLPKGTKIIDVEKWSKMGAKESEIILEKGSSLEIMHVRIIPNGRGGFDLKYSCRLVKQEPIGLKAVKGI